MKVLVFAYVFGLLCLISNSSNAASASRSDSVDIRQTIITCNITDFVNKVITANTNLKVQSKVNNLNELVFDLQGLTVDSVHLNGTAIGFNYTSPEVKIALSTPMQINDTAWVQIFYHGVPVADATWGGFSFIGNYGFQMGVGFNAQPHSFGRTWHACFDNFVERSPYEFYITTEDTKAGVCNGMLLDSTTNSVNNTKTWHWKLEEEIPSYLACVAVCNYVFIKKTLTGDLGITDALITCEAVDTNKVHGSFAHLQHSFTMLENHFGTHSWPRVGYSLVPFNAGAMEHATNISIGRPFIDGTLNYETLIAHELAHHWWGDLVTCSTAGDMWLNEGFASYCEDLHTEHVYGYDAYIDAVRSNHFNVLSKAHVEDKGYKSVANMDSLHTYGMTVYNKGQDVLHTLRSYMGDSLFFQTLESFLNNHKFQSISTLQLRDYLTLQSGIDLNDFFENWLLQPGFPNFTIDSIRSKFDGFAWDVRVHMRQRKHKSVNYYNEVPLELVCYNAAMMQHRYTFKFSGRCMQFNLRLPFEPALVVLDPNSKISDALTEEERMIQSTGNLILTQSKCRVNVKGIVNTSDSTLLRAEHHWVAPDRFKQPTSFPGFVLNDKRYWHIDGIALSNLEGTLQFPYDASVNNNFLDSTWLKNSEDSIRLFYRRDASEEWQFADDSLRAGSPTDKVGNIYAKSIKAGDYALGIKRSLYTDSLQTDAPISGCGVVTALPAQLEQVLPVVRIYPNPAHSKLFIEFDDQTTSSMHIQLNDMMGRVLWTQRLLYGNSLVEIPLDMMQNGLYMLKWYDLETGDAGQEKILVIH